MHRLSKICNSNQLFPKKRWTDESGKFKQSEVKTILQDVVVPQLVGEVYDNNKVRDWCIAISNGVNERLKSLNLTSFRYAVQVIIAQNWGEVVTEAKCSWDLQYDSYSSYIFINETMFTLVTVFAFFTYPM
ncbi:dynein light chain Tctex-type protein 2B [Aethina tumida]|uniref:dynein light chain Tctex-type protein 2B n=1 Tax=Aethina tumida TaxID=116153 RepID=UPI00096B198D|nr:dynein light chain Tctex-type protein 2B [Aethina tumida]